jgi:hypothetical protein
MASRQAGLKVPEASFVLVFPRRGAARDPVEEATFSADRQVEIAALRGTDGGYAA